MTTREQALTVDCPECEQPAGEMCVILTAPYVEGRRGPQRGYGSTDPEQIGREAKRPHNARASEHYWTHLPERPEALTWSRLKRHGQVVHSTCGWYVIYVDVKWRDYRDGFDVRARSEGARRRVELGYFETLEEAQAACVEHNAKMRS